MKQPTTARDLDRRWADLCTRATTADAATIDALYFALTAAYAVPPRAYHNLTHVADCLDVLEATAGTAADPTAVELAIWLHDAIYDPRRSDNEARSAALARVLLHSLDLPPDQLNRVCTLVLATRHAGDAPTHTDEAHTLDEQLIRDIDLAILGAPPETYWAYAASIRQEYDFADEAAFRAGRTRFLLNLLKRPRIYQTKVLHDRFEAAARLNLTSELVSLASHAPEAAAGDPDAASTGNSATARTGGAAGAASQPPTGPHGQAQ